MPFLLAEILNFQGSTHLIGVGSLRSLLFGGSSFFSKLKSFHLITMILHKQKYTENERENHVNSSNHRLNQRIRF